MTRLFNYLILGCFLPASLVAQTGPGLQGSVVDPQGAVIIDAPIEVSDAAGRSHQTRTDQTGRFVFDDLPPGLYTVLVEVGGFQTYQEFVQIPPPSSPPVRLNIRLSVLTEAQEILVESERQGLSLSSEENAGAIVITEDELDALPDDPEELAEALQALAGPSAGPNGGQFYVDGFSGGRMPPKSAIREIRINRNPFSAEYDEIGYGRVEILTRPGRGEYHGEFEIDFSDESLNSRDPFAPEKAAFQSREYEANLGGPLLTNRASFFVDFDRRAIDGNSLINARILDENLEVQPFSQVLVTPQVRTRFSPRIDFLISDNHTLMGRYAYERDGRDKQGIGEFALPSRAFDSRGSEQEFQLKETAILGPQVINETRFQLEWNRNRRLGDISDPSIQVLDAFLGGGSQVGLSSDESSEWEVHNTTSWTRGNHSLRTGGRVIRTSQTDISQSNFGGTFLFGGGLAPQLTPGGEIDLGPDGQPILIPVSSLERYRRTLLFGQQGRSPEDIRALGGGATQFSIAAGDPLTRIRQLEFAAFIQDDWRLRNDFVVSMGIRYETQSNLDDRLDFAPRLAFAWSPGGQGSRPSTVIRGGFGIFYDRISESLTLQTLRFDGLRQLQFVVSDPGFFPRIPSLEELQDTQLPQILRRKAADLQTPYSMQTALSVERQLPQGFTLQASFIGTRTLHALRSRSLPADPSQPAGIRRVYEFASDGRLNQKQLIFGLNNRFSRAVSFFSRYTLNWANGNTDGFGSFAADPFDLNGDYSRSSFDVRHRFFFGGSINLPWESRLSPFIIASSGRPYNITTGRDLNSDSVFSDRPSFASDPTEPGVINTPYGLLDPSPEPGEPLIPRNLGEGPGFFAVNMRLSKTIGFGAPEQSEVASPGPGGSGGWAGGRGRRGRRPSRGNDYAYSVTLSLQVRNLFNSTNLGSPVGNLSSPLFGQSVSTSGGFGRGGGSWGAAGNRRLELELRFSF